MFANKIKILTAFFMMSFLASLFAKPYTNIKPPEWSYNKNIYEVNLRQFTPSGTIKEFRTHLPRLKDMGVGILWFMPVHPIGEKNRKGGLGSYYSVKDYLGLDPYYGTEQEFKEMVDEIHSLGMYIIIDWVANHTAWDNPWIASNPEFYTKDKEGNFVPPVADWSDVIDLNFDNKELWNAMAGAMEHWVKKFDIDGFRCDVASMVPTPFWEYTYKRLSALKPVFMLAEAEEPELHKNSFHMTYSWGVFHQMREVAAGKASPEAIFKELNKEKGRYPAAGFRMRFTSNHDENSWNGTEFELFGDGSLAYGVLAATIPGMHLIYTGQEAGNPKRLSFFEKDTVDWSDTSRVSFYRTLNLLKKNNSALHNGSKGGSFGKVNVNNKQVFSFTRKNGSDVLVVVINLSGAVQDVTLSPVKGLPELQEVFSGEKRAFGKQNSMQLKPWQYMIYTSVKKQE